MTFEEFIMFVVSIYLILSLVVMVIMTILILCAYYRVWKFKRKYKTPLAVLESLGNNRSLRFIKKVLPIGIVLASWWLKMHPDQKRKRKK